jgi:radical SAM protein with 4Fe4S-binding SPASM domain
VPGAFEATLRGVGAAREAGLEFQVNTTITRPNAGDLRRILDLAVSLGAAALHPFLLVPTGRGREICDQVLVSGEYEEVLNRIYELALDSPIPLKPTCAPQYYRIFRQREKEAGRKVSPETHGLDAMTRGCLGGTGFAFISHVGKVQICGFMEEEAGDLSRSGLDFAGIWEHSQLYREMRDFKEYKGRCGVCEYRRWCGGCRARAFAVSEDYLAEEPYCTHVPSALQV